ncbi:DUF6807 family protein, partial [Streptomyces asiaticus]
MRAVDSAGGDPEGCQGPLWIVHTHGDRVTLAELLTQHPHTGELWAEEERRIEVHDVGVAAPCWALTWSSGPRTDTTSRWCSAARPRLAGRWPTTPVRRGPRAFREGRIIAPDAEGPGLMEQQSPWLAYSGAHDGTDG